MTVWRLQSKTGANREHGISQYCLDNGIAAMGWSLEEFKNRKNIKTMEEYKEVWKEYYKNKNVSSSINALMDEMKPGDFVWMRQKGIYCLGRVGENSKWQFNYSDSATEIDACNQRTGIEWVKNSEADESIAGCVTTAFIKGHTLQRIKHTGIEEYSQFMYNLWTGKNVYTIQKAQEPQKAFYSYLTTDDCEDLLSLYLASQYGYVCIPSTSKLSTPLYECIMIDPKEKEHVYIQVKKGNININANEYKHLQGKIYFLTTEGKVKGELTDKMYEISADELYQYALSEDTLKSRGIEASIKLATGNF